MRVISGSIFDVAVDIRPESSTYGAVYTIELSAVNKRMLYIPPGFAHGFLSLENGTELLYKSTNYYDPMDESGIAYNDPLLNIGWPMIDVPYQLSNKDKNNKGFDVYTKSIDKGDSSSK